MTYFSRSLWKLRKVVEHNVYVYETPITVTHAPAECTYVLFSETSVAGE
jgi:hypothetical protein